MSPGDSANAGNPDTPADAAALGTGEAPQYPPPALLNPVWVVRRHLWQEAAVATWVVAGVWSALLGMLATGMGCVVQMPRAELRRVLASSELPAQQVQDAIAALPVVAGCMGACAVFPGAVLMVLGWSIQQGRRSAMITAMAVVTFLGIVMGGMTLLSLSGPALPALLQGLLLAGVTGLCVRAALKLLLATQHPHDAGYDIDDDPYAPVL